MNQKVFFFRNDVSICFVLVYSSAVVCTCRGKERIKKKPAIVSVYLLKKRRKGMLG